MEAKKIKGYKGFDKNLKCRGFQYEVGKEYQCDGEVECCENGFHFCENPFDVFRYYAPAESRYCEVGGSGYISRDKGDTKVAVSNIRIEAEIGLKGIIEAGVKFIMNKVKWEDKSTNTGDQSAATNTGDQSAATNTGDKSAASVSGKESVAIVTGKDSKAKGSLGCWIVLTERGEWNGELYPIKEVRAFKVDGVEIKEDTYYKLIDGKAVEC